MAVELGVADTDLLIAGLLHDVVEDTDGTLSDLAARFGRRTAEFVGHVTMPDVLPNQSKEAVRKAYLARLRAAPADVLKLKLADTSLGWSGRPMQCWSSVQMSSTTAVPNASNFSIPPPRTGCASSTTRHWSL